MKNFKLFFIVVLAALMFAFSIGTLVSRNAQAQGVFVKVGLFPRQQDLWSLTAADLSPADANDWRGNNGGIFTVTKDHLGRLPVITCIHSGKGTDAGYNFNLDLADVSTHTISQFLTSSDTFHDNGNGVVLSPGTYFIQWLNNGGTGDMKRLLLSGYWALP